MPYDQTEDQAHWKLALQKYDEDLVDQAYELVLHQGVGPYGAYSRWLRLIEAEAATRKLSQTVDLSPWLRFEYVFDEVGHNWVEIGAAALRACNDVASIFDWVPNQNTLLSLLTREAEAPWSVGPFGYCVPKSSGFKICIPGFVVEDPAQFERTVRHEFAHVVTGSLSQGTAPRWVGEAVSVLVEGNPAALDARPFTRGDAPWLMSGELESTISQPYLRPEASKAPYPYIGDETYANLGYEKDRQSIELAYLQSGLIGRYLLEHGSYSQIAKFLRAHIEGPRLSRLAATLVGIEPTDQAFRKIYKFSEPEAFSRVFEWLRGRRP